MSNMSPTDKIYEPTAAPVLTVEDAKRLLEKGARLMEKMRVCLEKMKLTSDDWSQRVK